MLRPEGVVVVGAGHAGIAVASCLRQTGFGGTVTILGEEDGLPYDRPAVSKDMLLSDLDQPPLLRAPEYHAEHGIAIHRTHALRIDRERRRIVTRDGREWPYGHLVLATGGRPAAVPITGATLPGVLRLRSAADARVTRRRLESSTQVIVIGGGFIGLEVAAAARSRGVAVSVLEAADRLMARSVSPSTSYAVYEHHRRTGVDLRLGTSVESLVGDSEVTGALVEGGRSIPADAVLVAVGMQPRDELGRDAGLAAARGVLVDEDLRTTDPCISALGDCATVARHGQPTARLESVASAQAQAQRLVSSLCGQATPDELPATFWSHQGSLKLQIVGLRTASSDDVLVRAEGGRQNVFCFTDGVLTADIYARPPSSTCALPRGALPEAPLGVW
ncbi:NAD(P)/FAD-dependent oxidoreductase [Streptomyces spongiae]|uniref:Pyridine nucleotide-disulfide oxidoreductase n=1 Tax=Streptomyces spongiae TaxID=565072 RepID=A0A5N8XBU0_9ACTN|nr:FAD-dependent oxidoreductase [Streptomyces spongiae]MPY56378.1 pyridine nucleotide-disulfide oxidoreductase [Streptomyces spongiae]